MHQYILGNKEFIKLLQHSNFRCIRIDQTLRVKLDKIHLLKDIEVGIIPWIEDFLTTPLLSLSGFRRVKCRDAESRNNNG